MSSSLSPAVVSPAESVGDAIRPVAHHVGVGTDRVRQLTTAAGRYANGRLG
jgi:hypothetical protein